MSVLCCRVADFLVKLHLRHHPQLATRPFALLGPDQRVCAASPAAHQSGVLREMSPRQAQMRCPDVVLHALDGATSQAEQAALLAELTRWELPVEELGWGAAYVDLHLVATAPAEVRPLLADLGRRIQRSLGDNLQPALGWDSGKFTARAASACAAPGTMRMVGKAEEQRFLAPLSITLLPLAPAMMQQLQWLGIASLGQFAALPAAAVWQRFGQAGKLAQRWAQGKDDRPVGNTINAALPAIAVECDPPETRIDRVLDQLMHALRPALRQSAAEMTGWRRLSLQLWFMGGQDRTLSVILVEPVSQEPRLRAALAQQLQTLEWPGPLERAQVLVVDRAELPAGQLALFDEPAAPTAALTTLAHKLVGRYGARFFQAALTDAAHPAPERRARLTSLAEAAD